jgi:hypothetical protein
MQRRHFLRNVALLAPLSILPSKLSAAAGSRIRIAFIGAGAWGREYLLHALSDKSLDVRAICDKDQDAVKKSIALCGINRPETFNDYRLLLEQPNIDAVIIAAPWDQHYEIARAALLAGKHVACGTIMGSTVAEHQDIVNISKSTGRHYFTLDEHSYRPELLAVTDMVAEGKLGTPEKVYAGARFNTAHSAEYPVYPALAATRLVTKDFISLRTETKQQQYAINKPHPETGAPRTYFTSGEVNTIVLTNAKGQELHLQSGNGNITTGFHLQATGGRWMDLSRSIYTAEKGWEPDHTYFNITEQNSYALALQDFVKGLKKDFRNEPPVYAAATNSVIHTLALQSANQGNSTLNFPDFK